MPDSSPNSTTDRPIRRISSWKVFGIFCLMSFLILFGIVFIPWDVKPPVAPDLELQEPPLLPADNAFTYLETATTLVVIGFADPDGRTKYLDLTSGLDIPPGRFDSAFVKEALAANAAALAELEKAFACQRYASPRMKSPCPLREFLFCDDNKLTHPSTIKLSSKRTPWLDKYRALVRLQILKSESLQKEGDYAGAVKAGLSVLQLGRIVKDGAGSELEWKAGEIYLCMAWSHLAQIVTDAKTPEAEWQKIRMAFERRDDQAMRDSLKKSLLREYGQVKEILPQNRPSEISAAIQSGKPSWHFWIPYYYKPNMTLCRLTENYREMIAVIDDHIKEKDGLADTKPRPRQKRVIGLGRSMLPLPNAIGNLVISWSGYMAGTGLLIRVKLMSDDYQILANVLQVENALRNYERKYGQRPEGLAALVPEFLKAVPINPREGRPFYYSEKSKQILLDSFRFFLF
jgi:hypothetical protein